jgi:predicted DNA-binding transcriptional regulator YafY
MPVNKHALIRYHALDKCFSNPGRRFYIEDLILACNEALYNFTCDDKYSDPLNPGISRRQVLVDINFMESTEGWSANIERIKDGRRVYFRYEDKNFTINNQPITDEELTQLRETMLMLSRFKGLPQFEWIDSIITSLEDKFHLKGADKSVVCMESNCYADGVEYISPLFNAIINKTPLHIEYETFHNGARAWDIHPYYLKQYNNRWFLFGLNNDEYRNITNVALDRIVSITQASIPYIENSIIEDFDDYFYDIVGVSFPPNGTLQKVVLKFSEHRFPFVKAKPIHGSQKVVDANERIISLNLIPNRELESLLLSFGDDVEVIEPQSLRSTIASKIKTLFEKYSTGAETLHT